MGMDSKEVKTMKVGDYEGLVQHFTCGFANNVKRIYQLVGYFYKRRHAYCMNVYTLTVKFTGTAGFIWMFCKHHGIRNISFQGEQCSADFVSACDFQFSFQSLIVMSKYLIVTKLAYITVCFCHKV